MVVDGFEAGHVSDVVYLDLNKAFDSVPHEELLFKLWRLGITGPLWKWFLGDRQHFVHFEPLFCQLGRVFPRVVSWAHFYF